MDNSSLFSNVDYRNFCNSIANLTDTAVIVYRVKDLYITVKDALNKIWEYVLNICIWFDKNREIIKNSECVQKEIFVSFTKSLLAKNDYDVDYISENIDFFYGFGAFENFCKTIFILKEYF